jgi:predicted kinase
MVQLHGPDPPEAVFRPGMERVNALIRQLAERALHLGLDVVLDDGYWTRSRRDELRVWAANLGVPLRLYALEVSQDEAWRRVQKRNAELGSLYIAPETFELFFSHFEPLGPDELHETGTQTG